MSDLYDSSSLIWEWLNGLDSGEPLETSPWPGPRVEWAGQHIKKLEARSRFDLYEKRLFIDLTGLFSYKSSSPDQFFRRLTSET